MPSLVRPGHQVDGVWHTWIDYPKFHALIKRYNETGGEAQFTAMDYMAPTPEVCSGVHCACERGCGCTFLLRVQGPGGGAFPWSA